MDRGDFDKALEYYQKAQAEAKDPAALDATIQLIKDYQSAEDYVNNGQYTEAIAALKQLQNRVTDRIPRCTRLSRICSIRRSLPSRTISQLRSGRGTELSGR